MPSRPHSIYIDDGLWDAAVQQGEKTNSSAASIINTALSAHLNVTVSTTVSQMSHEGTAPTHRKPAVALDQRVESGGDASPTTVGTAGAGTPPALTPQQQRDQLLHGVATTRKK